MRVEGKRRWRGRREDWVVGEERREEGEYRSEQKKSIVYNNRIEDYNIIIV